MRITDYLILANLRKYGRDTLTKISRRTRVPISTIYERLKQYKRKGIIKGFTCKLDHRALGFDVKVKLILKVKKEARKELKEYLQEHPNINSIYKINNGYDFFIEAIFRQMKDFEEFKEIIEDEYPIRNINTYYIIEEIQNEGFLANQSKVKKLRKRLTQ